MSTKYVSSKRANTLEYNSSIVNWHDLFAFWIKFGLIITFILSNILFSLSYAVPASPQEITLTQNGGISFQARQWGDEVLNGFETSQGYTIVYDEYNAQWTYAMPDPDGYLVPSPLIVGIDAAPAWLPQRARPEGMALQQAVQMAGAMRSPQAPQAVPTAGTLNIPLILITFKDRTPTYTKQDFQNLLFGTGNKSMRDYYQEVSYGKLNISSGSAGVIGWYTASQNHDYYGYNQGFGAAQSLVKEAVQAADATVNFANYDSDNNCVVDGLMVVHQGTGTESSGDHGDIWSHQWAISYTTNDTAACGTIKVNTYSIQPEKLGNGISTMGVFAHEFGHVLGLPDLYDTDDTSAGVGNWDLMAGGSWNGVSRSGDTPAHLSAWGKIKLGWVTPTQVTSLLPDEPIEQAATKADVYRFVSGTEYYLIENRNRAGFDVGLPGSGLAIWHIDDAKGSNTAECIPPTNCAMTHYKVALVQADSLYQLEKKQNRGDAGDIYPGATGKTTFDDTSSPSAKLYSDTASLVTVKNISASGSTMKATLCYGNQGILTPSPTSLDFGEVSVGSSKILVLTISNTGCANLSIGTLTGSAMFKVKSTTCSTTLGVGANCAITFEFVPTSVGTITNTFTFSNGVSIPQKGIGKATTQTLTVSKNGTGLGIITSNPAGINCGSDCTEAYNVGTTVTLTATASAGSQFAGWTGACTGTGNCVVTMNAAKTVTATFNLIPKYNLSVSKTGSGTVTSSPTGINCGSVCSATYDMNTTVTLTATPNAGAMFTSWSGCATVNNNVCTVTMNVAKTVTATFGTSPDIRPSSTAVNFGIVMVGVKYGNETYNSGTHIYVYNKGGTNLIIGTVSITGTNASEFKEVNYSCSGKTVAPNSYCLEYIRVVASSAGSKTATLVIPSNDPDTATLNIPLSATAQEVLTPANTDTACALTPTIQTVAPVGNWAVYNAGTGKYDLPSHMWNPDRVPSASDVVLINPGHMVVGIPYAQVKALCNKGTLKSKRDSSLEIYAYANGISNHGSIVGNVDQHSVTKDQGTCANKVGNSVILKAPYAPIYNKGTIQAGPGGKEGGSGVGCAGHAGQALVYGRNVLNEGTIKSGKGGDITTNGAGGNGGLTYLHGEYGGGGSIVNKGIIISGDGGIGCPSGQGGDLYLLAHPQYLNGTFQSGKAGAILRNGCGTNRPGVIWIDPSTIEFGPNTKIEGGDIFIFGGDGWTLNFDQGTELFATGNITLQTGEGGEVNLANKPLIQAAGEVTILADHITTAENTQISDVVKATNITTGAGKIRYAVIVTGPGKTIGAPSSTVHIPLVVTNSGPTKDVYTLTVENSSGWEISSLPDSVELEGLEATDLALDIKLPATVGNTGVITIKAVSQSDTTVSSSADVAIEITTKMSPGNDPLTGDTTEEDDGNVGDLPPPIAYNASGTIRDQFGDIVIGVTLTAVSKVDSTKVVTGMTDDTGYWQVTGLTADEYTLTAEKAGYTFDSKEFIVGNGENAQVDINATKIIEEIIGDYSVHGTLKDKAGNPIANATVQVGDKTTTTDELGNWSIDGLFEGKYDIVATKDNFNCLNTDFELGNNDYHQVVSCTPVTTLKLVVKPSTYENLKQGEDLTYTETIINGGTQTATGVTLSNVLPEGATLVALESIEGQCNTETLVCSLPDLTPGATAEVKLTLHNEQTKALKTVTTLTSTEYSVDTKASFKAVKPHLSVTLVDTPDPVVMQSGLHYQAVVELSALAPEDTATDIAVVMQLPKGTELVDVTTEYGTCDSSVFPVITCQLNDLSIATPDSISRAVVDMNVKLLDEGLLILTHEAKVSAANYPAHTDRERTNIVIPPNAIADIVLVVDTTKSMDEELNGVIAAIEKFIQEQAGKGGIMPKVALVEFKDNVVLRAFTDNMDTLLKAVRSLTVEGGGLCPEASAEALNLAINHTKEGGVIVFSTDASPYPDADMAALAERIKEKGIVLKALVSGDCGSGTQHWNDTQAELAQ